MKTGSSVAASEKLARQLEREPRYRVLRAVPAAQFAMPPGPPPEGRCIALVDVETTGLDVDEHKLIELAILPAWVDGDGEVIAHYKPISWLEDPHEPLDLKIRQLTGLVDHDLQGKSIDDNLACALLERADLLIAHNASFDRKWIDRRYPSLSSKAWACSASEIDWLGLGFDGRAQQHLLAQHGWFANAHRAGDDVWSLMHLLRQERPVPGSGEQRSHLARLIEASSRPTELVEAVGAPFAKKDRLKARGYRWNARGRVWSTELDPGDLAAERAWFVHQGLPPFVTKQLTACERHR
ncbi:3'-5' exonuclease [Alteraurantiacibacter aquimixticola]|uniref:DNA polymerase III subunit epsilon n=1 Tax=Alteraurantiacibacter aquimixticola TaxID=2489173 RepID=A0A4T3F6K3_9SPHN|nr:3'-5' exonuclease [Alteraurantiacibacter aquimixticola]TIX50496.1 DNA polymerase III subunit epsilon [Alteraurantiacibacter aquimixticola]